MKKLETTDPIEAQRCRRAQYLGQIARLTLNGSRVTGKVRSVMEDVSSAEKRWIVTIVN